LEGFIKATLMRNPEKFSQEVSEVMTADVVACSPDAEVDNVWRMMQEESLAGLPVVDKGKLVGIVSQKDLLDSGALKPTFEAKKGRFKTSRKIRAVMNTNVASVRPSTKLDDAAKIMVSKNVGRVPVTDEKARLVGIVDREDIVRAILKRGA
jgi:CBS domain-containing protein